MNIPRDSLMERDQVALVLQTALLDEVSPLLRGVGFDFETDTIRLLFYYPRRSTATGRGRCTSGTAITTRARSGSRRKIRSG
jgi:hypothetical protein